MEKDNSSSLYPSTPSSEGPPTSPTTDPPKRNKKKLMVLGVVSLLVVVVAALFIAKMLTPQQKAATTGKQTTTNNPNTNKKEILLVTGEFPPFTSTSLPEQGPVSEIVAAAFKEMGTDYTAKFYPWARDETLVKEGTAFAAFPYSRTSEREKEFNFSDPFFITKTKLFYYKKYHPTPPVINTYKDLQAYKMGGLAGYYYLDLLNQAGITYDVSDDEAAAFQKLIANRNDFVPINSAVGLDILKNKYPNEKDNFGTVDFAPLSEGESSKFRLLVSKKYPDSDLLLQKFNTALKNIVENGTYTKILTDRQQLEGSIK